MKIVGCPSPRVQKGAFGAVLMKTPQTVVDIIQEMIKVGVKIPITVKCRIGVDNLDSYEHLCDFIRLISTTTPVTHFIVHARKCWLKGLSPKQNRSVPPLKYEVVYQVWDYHINRISLIQLFCPHVDKGYEECLTFFSLMILVRNV